MSGPRCSRFIPYQLIASTKAEVQMQSVRRLALNPSDSQDLVSGLSTLLPGLKLTPAFVSTPRELGLIFNVLALIAIRLLLWLSVIAISTSARCWSLDD
jgi:hypothetical protein